MTENLIYALISGLVAGGIAWGAMRQQVRALTHEVAALHVRVDAFMLALAQHGLISMDAAGHLSRVRERVAP